MINSFRLSLTWIDSAPFLKQKIKYLRLKTLAINPNNTKVKIQKKK